MTYELSAKARLTALSWDTRDLPTTTDCGEEVEIIPITPEELKIILQRGRINSDTAESLGEKAMQERRNRIVALRDSGQSFAQISKNCGISIKSASAIYYNAMRYSRV